MPTELFANDRATTLAANLTIGATTLTVASSAGFPTPSAGVSQFRALIGTELVVVTAVDGVTWTVARGAEGSTAAAHASGSAVTHTLTAAALDAFAQGVGATGRIHSTSGAPDVAVGVDGDYALDISTMTLWGPKTDDLWNEDPRTLIFADANGSVSIGGQSVDLPAIRLGVPADATQPLLTFSASIPDEALWLGTGQVAFSYEDTEGAPVLHIKGKDSAGTLFVADIPMTEA